jgi:hypothetical protein
MSAMKRIERTGRPGRPGDDPYREQQDPVDDVPSVAPALNPEFVERFRTLVDEVTDELMREGGASRQTCRADAIALLFAANEQIDDGQPAGPAESALKYILLEEQRRATALLQGQPDAGFPPALLKV